MKQVMIYKNIKTKREELGYSQEEMAKRLKISQSAYSFYEVGKRKIPPQVLVNMADIFGCSIDYLLGRKE